MPIISDEGLRATLIPRRRGESKSYLLPPTLMLRVNPYALILRNLSTLTKCVHACVRVCGSAFQVGSSRLFWMFCLLSRQTPVGKSGKCLQHLRRPWWFYKNLVLGQRRLPKNQGWNCLGVVQCRRNSSLDGCQVLWAPNLADACHLGKRLWPPVRVLPT